MRRRRRMPASRWQREASSGRARRME
jgi:hypothetical protein